MPVSTVNELIEYLQDWKDKDKPVVYTIFSVADAFVKDDNPFTEDHYRLWEDNIGAVDRAMGYAEIVVGNKITAIFEGEGL